jgi:hypothetical protein
MGLTAQLGGALDCGALATQFLGAINGPAANLNAVSAPVPGAQLDAVVAGSGSIDLTPVAAAVARVAQQALPPLAALPGPAEFLGSLEAAVAVIESLAQQDFAARFEVVIEALRRESAAPPEGGQLAFVLRIIDVLGQLPEAGLLRSVLGPLIGRAELGAASTFPVLDIVRGGDAAVRVLGALMCLATVLAEAERLAATAAAQLDPQAFTQALVALGTALEHGPGTLAEFITGVAANDPSQVDAALNAAAEVARRLGQAHDSVAVALGLGEATLVYLDVGRLQGEVDVARGWLRQADVDPIRRVLVQVAGLIDPLITKLGQLGLHNLPAQTLGALVDRIEAELGGIAASITALDPATFVEPLAAGIATLARPVAELNAVVTQVTQTLRAALGSLRDAVAALPVEDVAQALRSFLDPLAAVLRAIAELLDAIETALELAAGTTTAALGQVDIALATFKAELDTLFIAARDVVAAAQLDQVVGTVAQNIEAFAQLLQQAQMQPYFDTAVSAIGTATDVVEAVPFGLLPESMKADVDAAVRPIKDTDVSAVERDIEAALGIGEDGLFSLRGDIEAALVELRSKYQALLDAVQERDSRLMLAEVDNRLDELAQRVRTLTPELTLQPVQDAVDDLKRLVAGINLDSLLGPVRNAFTEINATLDRYSPSQLVAPLQQRLDAARGQLVNALKLDDWAPTLDQLQTEGLALLDRVDPARIQPLLESAVGEALALLANFPGLSTSTGFGSIVAGLLGSTGLRMQASSFPAVRRWLGGASASAELAARTDRFAQALGAARNGVRATDVQAQAAPLLPHLNALRSAAQGLVQRLAAGAPQRLRLEAMLPRLDGAATFANLGANRQRYLALLEQATGLAEGFRRTGFSEADAGAAALSQALAPLAPAGRTLQSSLAAVGLNPAELNVVSVAQAVLAVAPPARLAGLLNPLFVALRGRLQVLLQAVLAPVQDGVSELRSLLDAIDLAPLTQQADEVVTAVKAEIGAFHPDVLLQEPLAAFAELRVQIVEQDPMAQVTAILTALRDLIAAVLQKLSLKHLLEVPLQIYDEVLRQLRAIDPSGLLTPVLDQLDLIAQQVDSGLDNTVVAFQRLQAALPSGGGGSSGSVSVGIG